MASGRTIVLRHPRLCLGFALLAAFLTSPPVAWAQYPSAPQITKDGTSVLLEDYASLPHSTADYDEPITDPPKDALELRYMLGRAQTLASEPPDAPQSMARFFVIEQNGVLYLLDKTTKKLTTYIDFRKIFRRFTNAGSLGYAGGLAAIAFDPAYGTNGTFYTVHAEQLNIRESVPAGDVLLPGADLRGFTATTAINPPAGDVWFESVLIEWKDTNIGNSTFEGTAREILRVGFNFAYHAMGDVLFNPLARPGDADYGNLYVAVGDGITGERQGITQTIPQQLDALEGKILRITPNLTLRPNDALSSNGRYRIPSSGLDPNPFLSVKGARGEIYAYGFRNPHRMTWDPVANVLIANEIGRSSWEEVNVIRKGANYGWAEREGREQVFKRGANNGRTGSQIDPPIPLPSPDTLIVEGIEKPVAPVYPVAAFSHRDGLAIGSGFVYRGKLMPQLVGKYIFSDIATGRLFYSDLADMLAAVGIRNKMADIHELQIVYKDPDDKAAQGPVTRRMFDIVAEAYARKGGLTRPNRKLPGPSGLTAAGQLDPYGVAYGGGRADVRLAMGGDGEIYVMSKADGIIRKLVAVVTPPPMSRQAAGR